MPGRVVYLFRFWHRVAVPAVKANQEARMRAGFGVAGPLAPHKRPRPGKPLGGKLPRAFRQARPKVTQLGFELPAGNAAQKFHRGDPGVARPILGLLPQEQAWIAQQAALEAAAQVQKAFARVMGG